MKRRIIVLDTRTGMDQHNLMEEWAESVQAKFNTEPIVSGTLLTPFERVILEYDDSRSDRNWYGCVPFAVVITLEPNQEYTDNRRDLDLAIVSQYARLPVTVVTPSRDGTQLTLNFALTGGEPLWIDPDEWQTYAQLITSIPMAPGRDDGDYVLLSTDPTYQVAVAMAQYDHVPSVYERIRKHPQVDVWYMKATSPNAVSDQRELMDKYVTLAANAFRIEWTGDPNDKEALDELIIAFGFSDFKYHTQRLAVTPIRSCSCPQYPSSRAGSGAAGCSCGALDEKHLENVAVSLPSLTTDYSHFLERQSDSPFTPEWLSDARFAVMRGHLPLVTVSFTVPGVINTETDERVRYNITQAVLRSSVHVALTAKDLYDIEVAYIDDAYDVTFPVDSKFTYDQIIANLKPWDVLKSRSVADEDDGLLVRYALSKLGVRSTLRNNVVVWEGSTAPVVIADVKALRQALIDNLTQQSRQPYDPVTYREFTEMSPAALTNVVVTRGRNAYESKTLEQLTRMEDPFTRQPLTPRELSRRHYGTSGLFTVGPLLGLQDTPIHPETVIPLDGVVIDQAIPYFNETELVRAQLDERAPEALSGYHEIAYEVQMESVAVPLFPLVVADHERATILQLVSAAWDQGDFLSPWNRAYITNQRRMSDVVWAIPSIFHEAASSVEGSQRAIAYLRALVAEK